MDPNVIRECYAAYLARDRARVDALLGDDLVFHSPDDPHLDKHGYFERCWAGGDTFAALRIEKLFVQGNEAFVRYECETKDGRRFRNSELFRVEGGKIREIDVYYGGGGEHLR